MRYVGAIVFIGLLTLSQFASAGGYNYPNNKKGFWINSKLPDSSQWALKSGDRFTFEGDICVVKWKHSDKKEKCEKIKDKHIDMRAYFPDATTEVTSSLLISPLDEQKNWHFAFETPELVAGSANTFTIVIGSTRGEVEKLLKIKAKINKRIAVLEKLKFKHHHHGKHKVAYEDYAAKLKAKLQAISASIDDAIEAEPEILARLSIPLQVDNDFAAPMHYSSNFSGHKLALTIPLGSPIDGESTEVVASITNLSHLNFKFPELEYPSQDEDDIDLEEDENFKYHASLYLDDLELINLDLQNLSFGQTHTEKRKIGPLAAFAANKLFFSLDKSLHDKKQHDRKMRKWGALELAIPVSTDSVVPVVSQLLPGESFRYAQNMAPFSAVVADEFGRLNTPTFSMQAQGALIDSTVQSLDLTSRLVLTDLDQSRSFKVDAELNPLAEGDWTFTFAGSDYAGNRVQATQVTRIDRTKPLVALGQPDNTLTNIPSYTLPVIVDDHSPVSVIVLHNGNQVLQTSEVIFDLNVTLVEGINTFEVQVVDAAGNIAVPVRLNSVELDTIPPSIVGLLPAEGAILSQLSFNVSGQVSEALQSFTVNNQPVVLNSDKRFDKNMIAPMEGVFAFEIVASDLAGNITNITRSVQIVLKVINENLITIAPDNNTGGLIVVGLPGAARPGIQVKIYPNTSSQKIVTSNSDGSFEASFSIFNNVLISGYDPATDREDSVALTYNLDTTLSGVIKDISGNPLPGVTVSISDTGQVAVTNASGVFSITSPATGDKTLAIDGSTIPEEVSGPNKKYAKTSISVSIGTNQLNVLGDPIYLAPLMFDGTETEIDENITTIVVSPHAPGVELEVLAGTAIFPDGGKSGVINAIEISSDVASLAPLDFAKPDTVVALEPSGLTFSEPAQLTLPNVNEFPAGMQTVIMSKNSIKGIWEIGGIARVSEDGTSITTESGQGILHFSEVYAAPLGPSVSTYGNDARPETSTFDGAMTTSIQLPSYKVFDKDISTGLIYKSAWATPSMVVSSVFDVPRQEFHFSNSISSRGLFGSGSASIEGRAWIQPQYLDSKTTVENIETETTRYTGVPNKSLVSYGVDLSSLSSGVSPYTAHFDIKLEHMVVGTRTLRTKSLFGSTRTSQEAFKETRDIEKVFPSDVSGPVYIQNKKSSIYGSGWEIGSLSKIVNPSSPRLMLEDSGGNISTYSLQNRIETIYTSDEEVSNITFADYPNIIISTEDKLFSYDIASSQLIDAAELPTKIEGSGYFDALSYGSSYCWRTRYLFDATDRYNVGLWNNGFVGFTSKGIVHIQEDENSTSIGKIVTPNYTEHGSSPQNCAVWKFVLGWGYCRDAIYCQTTFSNSCRVQEGLERFFNFNGTGIPINMDTAKARCGEPTSNGVSPQTGFKEGENPQFNNIKMAINNGTGYLIADYGNHRVRFLDTITKQTFTVAGNGQTFDVGDGGLANQASLYRPLGLTRDTKGNLYISTENGYIRRVDINGFISTFAGKPVSNGGVFSDVAHAEEMAFNQPYGMVVDDENGFLYVADTGNHRVVRIDLETKIATVVAGNGTCVDGNNVGDDKSALDASLCHPTNVGLDEYKNLLIADSGHSRLRRVTFNSGIGTSLTYLSSAPDNSTLIRLEDGTFERRFRDASVMFYNFDGLETLSRSRIGLETQYLYDSQKRLVSMIDPVGKETVYTYFGDKLASITDPAGRETSFDYDGDFLIQVIFPDNTVRSFAYNERGLLVQEINQRGIAINYEYNEWNRLSKIIRADNSVIEISDVKSKTVGNAYVSGNVGQLKSLNDETIYDGIKNAKGFETKYNSDETGYVVSIIDNQGRKTSIERDFDGRPVKITRPDESFAEFVYEPVTGDLISKTDNGLTSNYQFNDFGDLLRQENSLGQWVQNVYEGTTGQLLSSTNHAGQTTNATYTIGGMVSTRSNAIGATTSYGYDQYLNLTSVTDALNNTTIYERDVAGNVVKTTNAKGQFIQNSFDLFNRLLSVTDARGNTTNYQYLATGKLAKVVDSRGNQTSFLYNNLGQIVEKTDPLGYKTALSYDLNGNVLSELDPNGNLKTFEYNSRDELVKKVLPDNLYEVAYDSYGNLESITDKNSAIEFSYTRIPEDFKIEEEVWTGRGELLGMGSNVLTHDYNSLGLVTNTSTLVGNYGRVYDNANRLSALLNPLNEEFQFDFDLVNRLTKISRPGSVTHNVFDATNFLAEVRHENLSGDVIGKFEYARNAIGNRTAMRSPAGENQFNYDSDQQVTSSVGPDVGLENFQYDELGNRTQDQGGNYVYDEKRQRLKEDYRFFYYYDNNGNLVSKISKDLSKTENYHYSSENQLIKIEWFESSVLLKEARYSFDALGRRMQKVVIDHQNGISKTRRFAYNGQEVIAQLDENNTILAAYTLSGLRIDDTLAVKLTSAGVAAGLGSTTGSLNYLKDGLGSITHLTNASGTIVQHYAYSVFGKLLKVTDGSGNDMAGTPPVAPYFTYTGREWDDESGLYHYRARYYSPEIGRFLSVDPDAGELDDPITFNNKYIYTLNSPLNYTDPSGQVVCGGLCIAAIVTLAAITIDSLTTGGNFFDNFGDNFEISNNEFWNVPALQQFALNYLALGGGELSTSAKVFASIGFTIDRAGNYYEDREQRGKVNRIDFGFGNHKMSSVFNTAGYAVGAIGFWGKRDINGKSSANKVDDWIRENILGKYVDSGWAIPRY